MDYLKHIGDNRPEAEYNKLDKYRPVFRKAKEEEKKEQIKILREEEEDENVLDDFTSGKKSSFVLPKFSPIDKSEPCGQVFRTSLKNPSLSSYSDDEPFCNISFDYSFMFRLTGYICRDMNINKATILSDIINFFLFLKLSSHFSHNEEFHSSVKAPVVSRRYFSEKFTERDCLNIYICPARDAGLSINKKSFPLLG